MRGICIVTIRIVEYLFCTKLNVMFLMEVVLNKTIFMAIEEIVLSCNAEFTFDIL